MRVFTVILAVANGGYLLYCVQGVVEAVLAGYPIGVETWAAMLVAQALMACNAIFLAFSNRKLANG